MFGLYEKLSLFLVQSECLFGIHLELRSCSMLDCHSVDKMAQWQQTCRMVIGIMSVVCSIATLLFMLHCCNIL